ncbi:hypothetical protein BBJ28_00013503 [Nothophytophthora sp. Chile5]|nr:hypothetical protein BBJ28_00013503 [Nothophytophthora sp. Chile5]
MQAWRKRMPTKRQLTSTLGQLVQQKSVAVLYTPTEQERIKQMTEMIAQATSDYEADEDWDRILRVVDALSSVSNRAVYVIYGRLKESIRYLRLRLGDPSSHVIILALTLTESLVKNCGDLVHLEIATEAFMNEMESLYRVREKTFQTHANKRGRESMEIASRVLDMVQAWGEAFLPYRHEFPLFVDTYHNMRKKGVKFPEQYDESKVPVLTSPPAGASASRAAARGSRTSSSRPAASYPAQNTGSIDTSSFSSSSSGLGGLSTLELYRVAMNVSEMFEDMLFEAQKDSSTIGNHGVIEELATQAREIVHRMEGAIPIAVAEGDEVSTSWTVNQEDEHNGGGAEDIDLIDPFGLKEEAVSKDNQDSSDDDPFSDFVRARAGSQTKSAGRGSIVNDAASPKTENADVKAPPTSAPQQDDEEDDPFASFVQHRATKILGGSNQDAEKELKPAVPEPAKDLIDFTSANDPFDIMDFSKKVCSRMHALI